MVDDWWQSTPGKIAAPPILSWESGAKACGDLSGIYGIWIFRKTRTGFSSNSVQGLKIKLPTPGIALIHVFSSFRVNLHREADFCDSERLNLRKFQVII